MECTFIFTEIFIEVIVDSHRFVRNNTARSHPPFPQFSPIVRFADSSNGSCTHLCVCLSSGHFLACEGLCTTTVVEVLNRSSTTGISGYPLRTTCNSPLAPHPYHSTATDLIFTSKILPCRKSSINAIIQYITFWIFSTYLA